MKYDKDIEKALSLCVSKDCSAREALGYVHAVVTDETISLTATDGHIILHLSGIDFDNFQYYYTQQGLMIPEEKEFLLNVNPKITKFLPKFRKVDEDLFYPQWKQAIPDEFTSKIENYPYFDSDIYYTAGCVYKLLCGKKSVFTGPDIWASKLSMSIKFFGTDWKSGFIGIMPINRLELDEVRLPVSSPFIRK